MGDLPIGRSAVVASKPGVVSNSTVASTPAVGRAPLTLRLPTATIIRLRPYRACEPQVLSGLISHCIFDQMGDSLRRAYCNLAETCRAHGRQASTRRDLIGSCRQAARIAKQSQARPTAGIDLERREIGLASRRFWIILHFKCVFDGANRHQ